jgi:hypothetical protein
LKANGRGAWEMPEDSLGKEFYTVLSMEGQTYLIHFYKTSFNPVWYFGICNLSIPQHEMKEL